MSNTGEFESFLQRQHQSTDALLGGIRIHLASVVSLNQLRFFLLALNEAKLQLASAKSAPAFVDRVAEIMAEQVKLDDLFGKQVESVELRLMEVLKKSGLAYIELVEQGLEEFFARERKDEQTQQNCSDVLASFKDKINAIKRQKEFATTESKGEHRRLSRTPSEVSRALTGFAQAGERPSKELKRQSLEHLRSALRACKLVNLRTGLTSLKAVYSSTLTPENGAAFIDRPRIVPTPRTKTREEMQVSLSSRIWDLLAANGIANKGFKQTQAVELLELMREAEFSSMVGPILGVLREHAEFSHLTGQSLWVHMQQAAGNRPAAAAAAL